MSLPAWECGLKYGRAERNGSGSVSLPAWECGLKSRPCHIPFWTGVSLPAWECGLKLEHYSRGMGEASHSLRGSVD